MAGIRLQTRFALGMTNLRKRAHRTLDNGPRAQGTDHMDCMFVLFDKCGLCLLVHLPLLKRGIRRCNKAFCCFRVFPLIFLCLCALIWSLYLSSTDVVNNTTLDVRKQLLTVHVPGKKKQYEHTL